MSTAQWLALSPLIVLAGGMVLLVLLISFWRQHAAAAVGSIVALLATLLAVPAMLSVAPMQVTPLFLFDRYAAYFCVLFVTSALVTAVVSYRYLQRRRGDLEEYYVLLLTATIGAMAMASAAHFASFMLGLEILSISLYVLVGYPEEHHAPLEAALKYLLLSGVASTTMLFGMAFLYLQTGTLMFEELAAYLRTDEGGLYVIAGNALLLAGMAYKLSLVPFHMWTPDVYEGAPAPVAGYLATVGKGGVFALAMRYLTDSAALDNASLFYVVSAAAVLSMVAGNLLALLQQNVKRILAYSSIAHLGYLLITLLVASSAREPTLGVEAALVYLAAYFAMTLGAFAVITVISNADDGRDADSVADFTGLFWRRPLLATSLAVMLLSLAGIPMTLGFIAKFYLFAAGVNNGLWLLLWALIVGSGIGLFYYLRIIAAMASRHDATEAGAEVGGSLEGRAAVAALALLLIGLGVYPTPLIDIAQGAAAIATVAQSLVAGP